MRGLDLDDRDVQIMLRIAHRDRGDGQVEVFPWELLHDLRELIACDSLSVSGQDSVARTCFASQELGDFAGEPTEEQVFWAHYGADLHCSYPDRSRDVSSITMISDFYSDRAYHDSGMYVDFLGPLGVEREIMVCLPAGPGRSLRLILARGTGRDFSERDRALLTLLRPHMYSAFLAAVERRREPVQLTERQQEVMRLVAGGYTNGQIARRLHVSTATVAKHLENVFTRLGVTNRTAAAARLRPDLDG